MTLSAFGCGGPAQTTSATPAVVENLHAVRNSYFEAKANLERPPRAKDELVRFLKKFGDPASLLRSPDDGEEFVIVYGIDPLAVESIDQVWAYERHGTGGGRWLVRGRSVQRLPNDKFAKLKFPPGHNPGF
jgi:hypothetical protein